MRKNCLRQEKLAQRSFAGTAVYQDSIAEKFLKAMKSGIALWLRPWKSSPFTLKNGITGHDYKGMNAVLLSITPYDPRYCTFNQARQKGWIIKKGSQGHLIRYVLWLLRKDENGNILDDTRPVLSKNIIYGI